MKVLGLLRGIGQARSSMVFRRAYSWGRGGWQCIRRRFINVIIELYLQIIRGGRSYRNNPRPKLHADGNIMRGGEATFAESDNQLFRYVSIGVI